MISPAPTVQDHMVHADDVPMLTDEQVGHIRHITNLAAMPDGEWAKMGTPEPWQEFLSALRYQLAHMAYTLGLAHRHQLPAAQAVFRPTYQNIMRKMLRREVWGYWRDSSRSGVRLDPEITELREGWLDPIVRENIMYSGHLHAMAGMYAAVFNDDRYAQPGALSIVHAPVFYGMGEPDVFEYDFHTLTDTIYWQMVENGWLGVACEPNCIFIVCNQFPMLGFRFHDIRHGTTIADEATASYQAAWDQKGLFTRTGNFVGFWRQRQDQMMPGGPSGDAWTGSIMNAWNPTLVRDQHAQVSAGLKRSPDGTAAPWGHSVLGEVLKALSHGAPAPDGLDDSRYRWNTPDFGYYAMYLSEMGDVDTLHALLAHADRHMNPTWDHGGLYYPRNDTSYDGTGNMTYVEPLTGNALIGYARLNVADGLHQLYTQPWDVSHFAQPNLAEIDGDLDVLRARYLRDSEQLIVSVRAVDRRPTDVTLTFANLPSDTPWTLHRDGHHISRSTDWARDDQGRAMIPITVDNVTHLVLARDHN